MGRSVPKTHRMNALNTSFFLATLAVTPLAAQQLPSQSPYFHVSAEDEKASLEGFSLQGSHVKVNIAGVIADVTVSQTYVNDTEVTLDADYIFPGSTRAAVYAMQMRINERVIKAVVKEKEEAQAIFKEAVEAGKTASLLEQERPNVFRTSFTNSQPTMALGKPMMDKGLKKAVWITWKYAAGDEAFEGFKEGYTKAGGTIVKELGVAFPNVEFQALLTEIASLKPDAVACFFAGGGAAKFMKDYAAAGLKDKIPLYGSGFLTEGTLEAAGDAAEGVMSTLHYADSLDTPRNKAFRTAYARDFKMQPDVYAVQGYDAGQLLLLGADAVKGDLANKAALYKAMGSASIDSPRGKWTMSRAHNPIQDIYLRKVENKDNKVLGVAAKQLADSGAGCKMA